MPFIGARDYRAVDAGLAGGRGRGDRIVASDRPDPYAGLVAVSIEALAVGPGQVDGPPPARLTQDCAAG
jgi:hypothetical protein